MRLTIHRYADAAVRGACQVMERRPRLGRLLYRAALTVYQATA